MPRVAELVQVECRLLVMMAMEGEILGVGPSVLCEAGPVGLLTMFQVLY